VRQALIGLEELSACVDSMLVIDNEKINDIYGDLSLDDAFLKADDILTMAAKGIAEIITVTGSVNVDFADVNAVMKDSGIALMGTGRAEGEDRAIKAVKVALDSPLLNNNDIKGAKKLLLNISSSAKAKATMREVTAINDFVQSRAGNNADLIWGHSNDDALDKDICVTLIATGFNPTEILNPYESEGGYKSKWRNGEVSVKQESEKKASEDENKEKADDKQQEEEDSDSYSPGQEIDLGGDDSLDDGDDDVDDGGEEEVPGVEVPIPNTSFQNIDFTLFREIEIIDYENTPAYVRKNVKINVGNYKEGKYQKFPLT
jgi:cell division protein FtsZ